MNTAAPYLSYMFRLLPNDTNPEETTYTGCMGKREIALADMSRTIFLDMKNSTVVKEILELVTKENSTLYSIFPEWKKCSVMVITHEPKMIDGSVCWYTIPTNDDYFNPNVFNFNWRDLFCTMFNRVVLNSSMPDFKVSHDKHREYSSEFDPTPTMAHSYSLASVRTLNGQCFPNSSFIFKSLHHVEKITSKILTNMYQIDWNNRDYLDYPAKKCTIPSLDDQPICEQKETETGLSTSTIILITASALFILGVGAYGAFKFLKGRKNNKLEEAPLLK